jgi:hypothetical protein
MNPVDLLELDDETSSSGIHLTLQQRAPLLEEVWCNLTADERTAVKKRLERPYIIGASIERTEFLRKNVPACPSCGGRDVTGTLQIQLVDTFNPPAKWKCRLCKTRFEHEPNRG